MSSPDRAHSEYPVSCRRSSQSFSACLDTPYVPYMFSTLDANAVGITIEGGKVTVKSKGATCGKGSVDEQ